MASRRPGDKPLSETTTASSPTHMHPPVPIISNVAWRRHLASKNLVSFFHANRYQKSCDKSAIFTGHNDQITSDDEATTLPADGPAQYAHWTSANTLLVKSWFYMETTSEGLKWEVCLFPVSSTKATVITMETFQHFVIDINQRLKLETLRLFFVFMHLYRQSTTIKFWSRLTTLVRQLYLIISVINP